MTGDSISGLAGQLQQAADTVPLAAANQLCDDINAVLDQLVGILGPDTEIVGEAQRIAEAESEIVRGLTLVRQKIDLAGQYHQKGPQTIADEEGGVRSFSSFGAAKRALGRREGQELHHIVEQSQAKPERSAFSAERINTTDNLAYVPTEIHRRISGRYSRKDDLTGMTLRDSLNGASWDEQYDEGTQTLKEEWNRDDR